MHLEFAKEGESYEEQTSYVGVCYVARDGFRCMSHGQIKQIGKPREIYDSPEDPFTAEFIGLANFFPGKATSEKTVCLAGRQELEIDGCRELNMMINTGRKPMILICAFSAADPENRYKEHPEVSYSG